MSTLMPSMEVYSDAVPTRQRTVCKKCGERSRKAKLTTQLHSYANEFDFARKTPSEITDGNTCTKK